MKLGSIALVVAFAIAASLQAATIHEAIDQGDSAAVAAMLDANPALLADRLPNGRTPLHSAAYGGKTAIVKLLLERGADANAMTGSGSTPLHGSALAGHEAIVRLLVGKGANINVTNQGGFTPLTNAATSGDLPTIKFLVESGAHLDPDSAGGVVALVNTINGGNPEAVDYLLDAGANPNIAPAGGESPLVTAVLWLQWDPARAAIIPRIVGSLLSHGANPNWAMPNGRTAIMWAASSNDTAIVKMLVDNGADIHVVTPGGTTPLSAAVTSNSLNSVKCLIGRGLRADAVDAATGRSALHEAVLRGSLPIVEAVLSATTDLNTVDSGGMTALDLALRYGHKGIASALRNAGAKTKGYKGQPPSASYLAQRPELGEAYLWYLGNCGYMIKTHNHCLVFDYWTNNVRPTEPSVSNGSVNPSEIAAEDVTVFVTHEHTDHFDSVIFGWPGQIAKLQYVFGFVPDSLDERSRHGYAGQPYEYMGPGMQKTIDGMQVMAVRSNDAGVGYVIQVDGVTIYHAGDLAGWLPDEREGFTSQIDSIDAAVDSVDIALVNVTGCHHQDTVALAEGTAYTIEKLNPKLVIPTHGYMREYYYSRFMSKFTTQFPALLSFCPVWRGDAVKFSRKTEPIKVEIL